jgi:integrase
MGMIYKRSYKRKDGTIGHTSVWWIKYYRDGRPIYESTETTKEKEGRDLLKLREGNVVRGEPVVPRQRRVTFDELAADVVTDYRVNGKRSLGDLERRITLHLKPFFGGRRMADITTADVRRYSEMRLAELVKKGTTTSNAQINRELAVLKRAFNLGLQAGKSLHKPYIPMLKEKNTRAGFFEPEQFRAVQAQVLSTALRPVLHFAYITGWRTQSEVLPLQWRQADFEAGTVRLDADTTKNGEGRLFPMTRELRALLEAQREYTRQVEREKGIICPWVFHREGKAIKSFRRAWRSACKKAGLPGMIPHDFRRTAVRKLVRAGIPERVAMTMTGHKTRSVFERYNIVSPGDLTEAARKLDAAMVTVAVTVGPKSASGGEGSRRK